MTDIGFTMFSNLITANLDQKTSLKIPKKELKNNHNYSDFFISLYSLVIKNLIISVLFFIP